LRVGNAEDHTVRTGTTVIMAEEMSIAVVDVRGGAPGTRDTESLSPITIDGGCDAIVLSGGSVFGLDAPAGVTSLLREQNRGFQFMPGGPRMPIVPGAILFDLANGGDKNWGEETPYRRLGLAAAKNAGLDFALGNAGAGLGATSGFYKGGLGSASCVTADGITVGAIVAVNSVGSPVIPNTNVFWSFPYEQNKEFGGARLTGKEDDIDMDLPPDMKGAARPKANTTIAVIATDADISQIELMRVNIMAADGFARALRPVHAPTDGDIVFGMATAKHKIAAPRHREVMRLGHIAADCLARAIARGVYEAESLGATQSYKDTFR
jgi:L-aminopeptidase/D-esterase-like protein